MNSDGIGVLVGIDESACAQEALVWAAADAAARKTRLTVATVLDLPRLGDVPLTRQLLATAQQVAQHTVDGAVDRARGVAPGVDVQGRVASGNPAAELLRLAEDAEEVVVGSHGTSGLTALLIGSVGTQVAEHARGPAVVVRTRSIAGSVLVAIDNSPHSDAALEYGFAYADRHGLPLVALHAYTLGASVYPVMGYPVPPYPIAEELGRIRAAAARTAEHSVGRWTEKYPDVAARTDVTEGAAVHQLVEASRTASLLVVGTRGHGGLAGMLLGSVSHGVMRHAHCPVVIAR
ncbi:MAG TPA: universal stress protein [Mycobacteriales bacterium]|jgi:nucleotide-binding universal stress UspA family protein|nr:universal stress protein [Mycobacteriales bacterium]